MSNQDNKTPEILLSTSDFFKDTVKEAFIKLNIQTIPQSSLYLVQLLDHYAFADNLYNLDTKTGKRSMDTLAEMYLKAQQSELPQKKALLKRLGDTSLYISGFFGDSLKKKIVDLDYYIDLGGTAYASLASTLPASDDSALLFSEFSNRFLEFVDALTYISQKSLVQTNADLLRLYDRYLTTGSELAREQLAELGLLNSSTQKQQKVS